MHTLQAAHILPTVPTAPILPLRQIRIKKRPLLQLVLQLRRFHVPAQPLQQENFHLGRFLIAGIALQKRRDQRKCFRMIPLLHPLRRFLKLILIRRHSFVVRLQRKQMLQNPRPLCRIPFPCRGSKCRKQKLLLIPGSQRLVHIPRNHKERVDHPTPMRIIKTQRQLSPKMTLQKRIKIKILRRNPLPIPQKTLIRRHQPVRNLSHPILMRARQTNIQTPKRLHLALCPLQRILQKHLPKMFCLCWRPNIRSVRLRKRLI